MMFMYTLLPQDSVAVTSDFPKALAGITHLFKATPGQRLVVPESLVIREELANIRNPPPPREVDLSDPAAAAREEGVSKKQLMAGQRQVLKEAENFKKEKEKAEESAELNEVKLALDRSVNMAEQKRMMADLEKAKLDADREKREQYAKTLQSAGPSGGNSVQRQNSWQPGNSTFVSNTSDSRNSPHTPPRHNDGTLSPVAASVGSSNLAVGSTVQVATANPSDPPRYGVIKWIGEVTGVPGYVAGIALVSTSIVIS